MTQIRTWTRHREGKVPYVCENELPQLTKLVEALNHFLEEQSSELAAQHMSQALDTFGQLLAESKFDSTAIHLPTIRNLLSKANPLQQMIISYACSLLETLPEELSNQMSIARVHQIRVRKFPVFFLYQALCSSMDRIQAEELLKEFVTRRAQSLAQHNPDIANVDAWWDELEEPSQVTEGTAMRFNKGRLVLRVEECILHEAMMPLGDPELADIVCCYGDKPWFEALNPNLLFTRATTLMVGPYCDTCMHDKRHSEDLSHPNHDFFRNLQAPS